MTLDYKGLFLATLQSPQDAAEQLKGLQIPREAIWLAAGAVSAFSALISQAPVALSGGQGFDPSLFVLFNPLVYFAVLLGSHIVIAYLLDWTGRSLSGAGDFETVFKLVTWLQVVFTVVQAITLFVMTISPPLGALIWVATTLLYLFCLVQFVKVAHGFETLGPVLMTLLGTFVGLLIAIAVFATVLGLGSVGGPV